MNLLGGKNRLLELYRAAVVICMIEKVSENREGEDIRYA